MSAPAAIAQPQSAQPWDAPGLFPAQHLRHAIAQGWVRGADMARVQPASLDLALGDVAHRVRASFLPGEGRSVEDALEDVRLHTLSLAGGAVLETGAVYLIPLAESLALPEGVEGLANPKSSTGRLDVFTRVIGDRAARFDHLPAGYGGPLWVEVAPRTFPVLVRPGAALVQLRLRRGALQRLRTEEVGIDLLGPGGAGWGEGGRVGFRARRHSGVVDVRGVGADGAGLHAARDFWDPLFAPEGQLVLDPDEFYILASRESVSIPAGEAAEMAPVAPEIGEFRAHYAGFFDPGFGVGAQARAVLEVRGRDVPFLLRHGQPVARLLFEPLQAEPDALYGRGGGNYQGQGLKLGKHFRE